MRKSISNIYLCSSHHTSHGYQHTTVQIQRKIALGVHNDGLFIKVYSPQCRAVPIFKGDVVRSHNACMYFIAD